MSRDDAAIVTGLGLHSSLGDAVTAAAAFRSGMSRARQLPDWTYFDSEEQDEQTLVGHPAMGLGDGFQGIARLLKLGTMALGDLASGVDLTALDRSRLAVLVVLPPEHVDEGLSIAGFLARLCAHANLAVDPHNLHATIEGRVGVASALREAMRRLAAGESDHVIVGAIDSLLSPARILTMIETGAVKTVDDPAGAMPGEAAAFVLLQRASQARREGRLDRGAPIVKMGLPVSVAVPEGTPPSGGGVRAEANHGKLLAEAALAAWRSSGGPPTSSGTLFVDLNGSPVRALDFGHALLRLGAVSPLGSWRQTFPAVGFGETGAASGLVAACLAVRGLARGYAGGSAALVLVSDDAGDCAALSLTRADAAT
jgi:3-oxoacyl-[acyl-carrier-protein] synthase-1